MSTSNYDTRRATRGRPNPTRPSSSMAASSEDESIREPSLSDEPIDDSGDGISTQEKLQRILDLMQSFGWSPRQLFLAWVGAKQGSASVELGNRFWRTSKQRKDLFLQVADEIGKPQANMISIMSRELKSLVKRHPCFGQFDEKANLEDIDFADAYHAIENSAPLWHSTMMQLLSPQRAHRASARPISESHSETLSQRLFALTSMVCFSRSKQQSNFLPSLLGTYLLGSGTKRRVIESLSGLGVCPSYSRCKDLLGKIAKNATEYESQI